MLYRGGVGWILCIISIAIIIISPTGLIHYNFKKPTMYRVKIGGRLDTVKPHSNISNLERKNIICTEVAVPPCCSVVCDTGENVPMLTQ